ncbi:MAG: metal-sensitive transcriptional regulator [SAR324 cluster bacterium]|nr:metal-sensitive transcriptional regulator [SAR324 cluster bacterium]MCH8885556.1 metal-sensitive transcriptional regulator [SAR324 cluster bacterium]
MRAIKELYPNHEEQLNRLSKIEGQLRGVRRMIEDRRYCIDIISQIKAINAALKQVRMGVLEKHIHHCVAESLNSRKPELFEEKVTEIIDVLGRME